jgi:hypothetical protein
MCPVRLEKCLETKEKCPVSSRKCPEIKEKCPVSSVRHKSKNKTVQFYIKIFYAKLYKNNNKLIKIHHKKV